MQPQLCNNTMVNKKENIVLLFMLMSGLPIHDGQFRQPELVCCHDDIRHITKLLRVPLESLIFPVLNKGVRKRVMY